MAESATNQLKPTERDPFAGTEGQERQSAPVTIIHAELERQLLQLKALLDESERKRRALEDESYNKRKALEDEIYNLKRDSVNNNTESKLAHKEEIHAMERNHDKEIRAKENEINDLKTEIRFKDLERKQGERDFGSRLLDFAEEIAPDFFTQVLAGLQNMGGQNPQQYTPEQLQAAFAQAAEIQEQQAAGTPEGSSNPPDPAATPGANVNPNPGANVPFVPEIHGLNGGTNETFAPSLAGNPQQVTSNPQPEMIKETLKNTLIESAVAALTDKNASLEQYGSQVRSQLALYRQQGINLDVRAWAEMASVLAETAIEREITAERVAGVVEPALDGVKQYSMLLKWTDPEKVSEQVFNQFNIQAGPPVRKLVTKVLAVIQQSL